MKAANTRLFTCREPLGIRLRVLKQSLALFAIVNSLTASHAQQPVERILRDPFGVIRVRRQEQPSKEPKPQEPAPTRTKHDSSSMGTLHFSNGDFLPGRPMVTTVKGKLRWKSPSFKEAISFDIRGIDHALFRSSGSSIPPSTSRVTLRNENPIYGDVVSIDEETIQLVSDRHGTVRFFRDAVERIDAHGGLLFDGLIGLDNWDAYGQKAKTFWTLQSGRLNTIVEYASIFHEYAHNGPLALEVELSSTATPKFLLALAIEREPRRLQNAFSLEVWDSKLVAHRQAGDDFKFSQIELPEIRARKKTVKLEVYLNPTKGELLVYSQGELQGKFEDLTPANLKETGVMLRNTGKQLTLERFRLSRWNGKTPLSLNEVDSEGVRLEDGAWVAGKIVSLDESTGVVRLQADDAVEEHAFDRIDFLRFARTSSQYDTTTNANVRAEYHDGSVIDAELAAITQDGVTVRSNVTRDAFRLGFKNMRRIIFRTDDKTPAQKVPGILEFTGCRLHGAVVGGSRDGELNWRPAFSDDVVSVDLSQAARITFDSSVSDARTDEGIDQLRLVNGDVIPGRIMSADEDSVTIRLPLGENKQIPSAAFKSMQLNPRSAAVLDGFKEPRSWSPSRFGHRLQIDDGRLTLNNYIFWGRDVELPDRAHVSFDAEWEGDGNLAIGVGGTVPKSVSIGKHYRFVVSRKGERLSADGRLRNPRNPQEEFAVFQNQNRRPQIQSLSLGLSRTAHIDIYIDRVSRDFQVMANGRLLFSCAEGVGTKVDGGVIFFGLQDPREANMYRLRRLRKQARVASAKPGTVHVRNLLVTRWPGMIGDQAREKLLTRRRGTRPDDTSHILRSATGDALRGKLVSLDEETVTLTSRLSQLKIPRERVVEIIRLDTEVEAEYTAEGKSTVTAQLHGGGNITLKPIRSTKESLTGKSLVLGEFKLPWQTVFALQVGQGHLAPENPLASWKLLEPTPLVGSTASPLVGQPAPDFALRTVNGGLIRLSQLRGKIVVLDFWATWCQPCIASVPKVIDVVDSLSDKGVVLLGVNQGEPVEIVRPFLEERQWQLQVALDSKAEVSGQYGVVTLPRTMIIDAMGIVQAVHTGGTPDLETVLSEQLQSVLEGRPVAADSKSPLLDVDLSDSTLEIAEGGNVRLLDYAGKVVVLDFWATWCAPCIRALPQLVELCERAGEDKVVLIAVNQLERPEVVTKFIRDQGWKLNVALDPKGQLRLETEYRISPLHTGSRQAGYRATRPRKCDGRFDCRIGNPGGSVAAGRVNLAPP